MNGTLRPSQVTTGTNKKVWWKGKCGHEWEARIVERNKGSGCPYCSNHKLLVGFNDFLSKYPELSKEWHPTKNADLKPSDIIYGSNREVWWLGKCGHEWRARLDHRKRGAGCPYCSGRKPIAGKTDLATVRADIIEEWDYRKNKDITPQALSGYSNVKVWWKCKKCGKEQYTSPHNKRACSCNKS